MPDKIILNQKFWNMREEDLPCLITYGNKSGGSYFSVVTLANLLLAGSKVLLFTAYPMAKDNFLGQIKGGGQDVSYISNESELNSKTGAIIIESGNEELFLKALEKLDDIEDRVVLIKNIEVFDSTTIEACLKLKKVIISGDIDLCSSNKLIMDKQFNTIVIFSNPKVTLSFDVPELEKYKGYLWSINSKGIVAVQKEN
ncbi:MAG: hypothetical protein UR85_C0006G0042 [Candidatus Nomurabacteria bacterium GW2011_GWF2_35_66]|uniref:Uncharacterized protein n=1 Tax=Candidatus Nomurabacteria bacterium GW2011_GWE1_35_16 TaxID=1618761 RepID=A0A0G0DTJ1_9BACT|nr:MAG: hypothetical protein UR55_C0008G0023 [Candidatus Nomurabacteria bacterium GW2011_GWF1_34_20]KKP63171.1 MAG: hypothetical protein UR57_C0008G0042 [Candidatus Nomurabacteria bacterium GW2011_GWE2_34_25]KKP66300.1 MAG: hypothetical protein UR64_C0009G0003 [Candidatus Nomurabacteria bacterium GW2011_GWE1_35_16]KKP83257.1 MAG: hypothetical protein UR85_C0006G0042 [Candidatus Nomurabacteria bacterium GW2011_GWF2_35_66]HAE36728.1 hypothetical protein [Candidatus Nomurabacteria bacterium]